MSAVRQAKQTRAGQMIVLSGGKQLADSFIGGSLSLSLSLFLSLSLSHSLTHSPGGPVLSVRKAKQKA